MLTNTQIQPSDTSLNFVKPFWVNLKQHGFNPTIPLKEDGTLIEPPRSEPKPSGEQRKAIKAPSPPEEPPAERNLFQAFLVYPNIKLTESQVNAPWATFDFTKIIAPER